MKTMAIKILLGGEQRLGKVALLAVITAIFTTGCVETAHAKLPGIGVMGDSLMDEYAPVLPWGGTYGDAAGRGWVQQLAANRGPDSDKPEMDFGSYEPGRYVRWTPRYGGYEFNWARSGASTHTLLTEGQHTGVAAQVSSGSVDFVFLSVGGNDFSPLTINTINGIPLRLTNVYAQIYNDLIPFTGCDEQVYDTVDEYIDAIKGRYSTALETLDGVGARVILGTATNHGTGAKTQTWFPDPVKRQHVTDAVEVVNDQIRAMIAERGIVGADIAGLYAQYDNPDPLIVGGVEIIKEMPSVPDPHYFFLPDGMHPGTVVQGLFANTVIEAMNRSYGTDFTPLSDQEILANAGIPNPNPGGPTTYFNVSPFVIIPEPSTVAMLGMGMICLFAIAFRRREHGN